jgi:putative copper resistance protein D
MTDSVVVLVRALSFIAMFQAAGAAVFLTLFRAHLSVAAAPIARLARIATLAAAALVVLHFSLEAAGMQRLAWHTAAGTALCLRLGGLLLVMSGLITERRLVAGVCCTAGTALLVGAFASLGHTVDHPHRAVLAALLAAHLLSITFWFGALWPLRQVVTLETPARAAAVLEQFSRIALRVVPALLLAGAALVLLLVPGLSVFAQPYGQLLLAKIVGFSALLGFGALNKLRLTPALRQNIGSAVARLRRSLAIEYGIMGAVLAITAVMTGLYSPD